MRTLAILVRLSKVSALSAAALHLGTVGPALVIGAIALATQEVAAQSPRSSVAGTYAFWVCKTSCTVPDSTQALVWGTLVLTDSLLPYDRFSDSARRVLRPFPERAANGCYVAQQSAAQVDTYAGGLGAGTTEWTVDSTGVRFRLYRSPDAMHAVVAQFRGAELRGVGRSSGVGAAATTFSADTVVARRLGPPDLSLCDAGAVAAFRRLMRGRGGRV